MAKKFRNKYRIESARLKSWDYSWPGMYFVTICTDLKIHYFGKIENKQVHLSEMGKVAASEWMRTLEVRPDMNLELGEFVIMPDHVHGIVIIHQNEFNGASAIDRAGRDARHGVSTTKNLGSIIRGFKSAVTMYARKNGIEFAWQSRFHDRVIRSYDEFVRVSYYIKRNPENWIPTDPTRAMFERDKFRER